MQATEARGPFLTRLAGVATAGGPDWMASLRVQAADRFTAAGLPTPRQEDWKYTNLKALGQVAFTAPDGRAHAGPLARLQKNHHDQNDGDQDVNDNDERVHDKDSSEVQLR